MLKHEVTKQADAIEKLFCIPFSRLRQVPMTKEESSFFIQLCMSKNDDVVPDELKNNWVMQAVTKRMKHCFTYTTDNRCKLFLLFLTEGNIGSCIMYLTYLQYISKTKNIKHFEFEKLADIFPMGFPSRPDMHTLWDATKVERNEMSSDNLIDYGTAMQSLITTSNK